MSMVLTDTPSLAAIECAAKALATARKDRTAHPAGTFDKQGRWYPAENEVASCCRYIRTPSAAWPYSLLLHCRSGKHCAQLLRQRAGL